MTTVAILNQSKSAEWYTPAKYIQAVREVLGGIELDPASCEEANRTVKADRYFTEEQDGLLYPWVAATVFLNPPYGRRDGKSNQQAWINKLLREYKNAEQPMKAILLVNACPYLSWFKPLWDFPICFTDHKIRFDAEGGEPGISPTKGNAFVYFGFGGGSVKFKQVFSRFGKVVMPAEAR